MMANARFDAAPSLSEAMGLISRKETMMTTGLPPRRFGMDDRVTFDLDGQRVTGTVRSWIDGRQLTPTPGRYWRHAYIADWVYEIEVIDEAGPQRVFARESLLA